jgi:hypothetical protein
MLAADWSFQVGVIPSALSEAVKDLDRKQKDAFYRTKVRAGSPHESVYSEVHRPGYDT